MMALIIIIHVIVCSLLIAIILVQRGRGGGLAESFSDVESMFGTKTNTFLTRTTTVLSTLFFLTCLSLAVLSVRQSRSLMLRIKMQQKPAQTVPASEKTTVQQPPLPATPTPATQTPSPQAAGQQAAPKEAPETK